MNKQTSTPVPQIRQEGINKHKKKWICACGEKFSEKKLKKHLEFWEHKLDEDQKSIEENQDQMVTN